ncbi:MAG: hypothetical protein MUF49_19450 [Oculatellaceae cyanobacterium Prado106]|jgi:hypothetical protein|nr:hypothetical protein [Oculatellaceae cyanobacterium Prado106]
MDLNQLQELKQRLTTGDHFGDIWNFYMDQFADVPEFLDQGRPAQNKALKAMVRRSVKELFGHSANINLPIIIYIAKHKFYHGPIEVNECLGGIIYFEDAKQGLIAVPASLGSDEVKYVRFTEAMRIRGFGLQDMN